MPELDENFNLKDWEWIAVHFPRSEREAMAKVAWFICCKCTPEEIYQYNNLDPRIVIPLCGIVLLDKKDFLQLKKFLKEKKVGSDVERLEVLELRLELLRLSQPSELSKISELSELKQEYVNQIKQVFPGINLSQKWQSLFETLGIDIQFALLYSLIKHRPPTRDDWRNIFCKKSDITFFPLKAILYLQSSLAKSLILYFFIFSGILFWMLFLYLISDFIFDFSWKINLLIWGIILVVCSIFLRAIIAYLQSPKITNLILYFLIFSGVLLWMILLSNFLWKTTLLVKVIILVACSILWIYGKNIYRKVTNPLTNIFK
ncbi:hypothetical protein [Okeania sp. SIO1I7]|uniref:hypothetical protein n=1 Tax=Okeania sp. SIO1I7 TaxID=2607772 RepID=UPI0013F74068|nr:hypothetical protein [Okeania sp. SIO1I7]NET25940.1 MFS transporter [Okeania sp. SIO1I7]